MLDSFHAFLSSTDFSSNQLFRKNKQSVMPSECQIVWVQIRPDVLSGLIWVQTVCKGYQQTTPVGKVKHLERFLWPNIKPIAIFKQCGPGWNAAQCGISSESRLFYIIKAILNRLKGFFLRCLRTTNAQTNLRIRAFWSAPLLFAYWKV